MRLPLINPRKKIRRLGYRKQIMPVVEKGMSKFLITISINSSYVALAICDIASESFYEHSISDFLVQIPQNLSFPNDFSPYLKPYISQKFRDFLYSDSHELIIGAFFKYYLIRFPVLIQIYDPLAKHVGPSVTDMDRIANYSLTRFNENFPAAAKELMQYEPEDPMSIFHDYAYGKKLAHQKDLESEEMQKFLYQDKSAMYDVTRSYITSEAGNVEEYVEMVFTKHFKMFSKSFITDYKETLLQWYLMGAFEGSERKLIESLWENLEERLDKDEVINYKRPISIRKSP